MIKKKKHDFGQTKALVERACLQKMPSLEPLGGRQLHTINSFTPK